jgi:hypothetical protein
MPLNELGVNKNLSGVGAFPTIIYALLSMRWIVTHLKYLWKKQLDGLMF